MSSLDMQLPVITARDRSKSEGASPHQRLDEEEETDSSRRNSWTHAQPLGHSETELRRRLSDDGTPEGEACRGGLL